MTLSREKAAVDQAADTLNGLLKSAPDNPEISDFIAVAELRGGNADAAMQRLQGILDTHPAHLEAAFGLAQLKLRQKDLKGAEQVLQKAVETNPRSVEANVALAQYYVLTQQPQLGEQRVRRALDLDTQNINALALLAAIQISQKRQEDAERTFKQIAALPDRRYRPMYAIFLAQLGRRDDAVAEFEKLWRDDPTDLQVRSRLVGLYLQMNRTPDAQRVVGAALKKNSKDINALFEQSLIDLRQGQPVEAEKSLKAILAIAPNAVRAHYALGSLYQSQRRIDDQRLQLSEALRLDPNFLQARIDLARGYLESGEPKTALDLLNQTPAAQKNAPAFLIERNWALWGMRNLKDLKESLAAALKIRRFPDLVLQDGLVKFKEKDYAGARVAAEEVLRLRAGDPRAALLLADSYGEQGQAAVGHKRLEEIAGANPKSAALQQLLGDWYANSGKIPEARKAFENAKSDSANFVQADLGLAKLDRREGKIDDARQRLTALISADSGNIAALIILADLEEASGNRTAALAKYRAVMALDPKNVSALNNLAYEMAADDPETALKFASEAAQIAPEDPAIQDTLGWIFYKKGLYLQAEKYLKQAVQKSANNPAPQYQYHLAKTYLKSGETAEGQKLLASALRQKPELAKTESGW